MYKKNILHIIGHASGRYVNNYLNLYQCYSTLTKEYNHTFLFKEKGSFNPQMYTNLPLKFKFLDDKYLNINKFIFLLKEAIEADLIIVHGMSDEYIHTLLFLFNFLAKKTRWVVWGDDLYHDLLYPRLILSIIRRNMKKRILKHLDGIISLASGDYNIVITHYSTNAKYFHAFYPNPINFKFLTSKQTQIKKENISYILLGNSAHQTNEHFNAMDSLSMLNNLKKFKIICPLSYGNKSYATKVIDYGNNVFPNQFIPIQQYLKPEIYAKILLLIDVAVMNHKRPQALGTIIDLLFSGKKVYIRKNISTSHWLKNLGIVIFDIENIERDIKNNQFFNFDIKHGIHNKQIIKKYFSNKNCLKLWKHIFDS